MAIGTDIVIEAGRQRLRAVEVRRLGRTTRLKRSLVERIPSSLDVGDAESFGAWMGEQLNRAGFPRGKATVSLPRERVALKRLQLPTTNPGELVEMTRLAMRRDLPFDAESAVIDFVPVGQQNGSTEVIAVAAPGSLVEWARRAIAAAGVGLRGISIRSLGTAALIAMLGDQGDDATLAIDIAGDSVELSVISNGFIRFSRAPELPELSDQRALAEAVITETRRTWMSYRSHQDQLPVSRAVLIGDPVVCRRARAPIAELLDVETTALDSHPGLEAAADIETDGVWPLYGLLLADSMTVEQIDLSSPRKAPDLAARKRQQVLAAAAMFLIAASGAWTIGHQQSLKRQRLAATLQEQARAEVPSHDRFRRDEFKLQHLDHWQSTSSDWLEHARHLLVQLPQPQELVLDNLTGNLSSSAVRWTHKEGWSTSAEIKLTLEGEARQRLIADSFRAQLVRDALYEVNSTGAETVGGKRLPHGFTFNLRSACMCPPGAEPEKPLLSSPTDAKGAGS